MLSAVSAVAAVFNISPAAAAVAPAAIPPAIASPISVKVEFVFSVEELSLFISGVALSSNEIFSILSIGSRFNSAISLIEFKVSLSL
ncbi:unknown [Clostridium sp. CAG:768]|nr:unknown [Clostridium sp. CAG:768]